MLVDPHRKAYLKKYKNEIIASRICYYMKIIEQIREYRVSNPETCYSFYWDVEMMRTDRLVRALRAIRLARKLAKWD